MGNATAVPAVADAGPIIHLAEIGTLHFLNVFSQLHIPDMVWAETVGAGRTTTDTLMTATEVHRKSVDSVLISEFIGSEKLERLHRGECEAIFLCRMLGVKLLLTDDMLVRETARRFEITPVGSLGIVIRAMQMRLLGITEAEAHLLALYEKSSLFVTRDIVELAINQLRNTLRPEAE